MNKNKIINILQISTFPLFVAFLFSFLPLSFIFNNFAELDIDIKLILTITLKLFFFIFCSLEIIVLIINKYFSKFKKLICSCLFVVGTYLYFEHFIILPQFGKFIGQPFVLTHYIPEIIEEILFLLVLIFILFIFKNKREYLKTLSLITVIVLLMVTSTFINVNTKQVLSDNLSSKSTTYMSHKYYSIDFTNYNVYSKKQNVVVIILDAFSSNIFSKITKKYPELLTNLNDFEWYPNYYSKPGNYRTMNVLPIVFNGKYLPESCDKMNFDKKYYDYLKREFSQDTSILPKLKIENYVNEVYPLFSNIMYLDPSYMDNLVIRRKSTNSYQIKQINNIYGFEFIPTAFKKSSYKFISWFGLHKELAQNACEASESSTTSELSTLYFYNKFVEPVKTVEEKQFKFYHLMGTHVPYELNKDLVQVPPEDTSVEETAYANLKIVEKYIETLKKANVYDNTAIIIMGDHGLHLADNAHFDEFENGDNIKNPLLLYKGINQKQSSLKIISNVVPDVIDIANLVGYSAGIYNKKFNITSQQQEERLEDMKKYFKYNKSQQK